MARNDRRKAGLFEAIAVMGKAFGSPRRLELLDLLAQGPRSVDQLAGSSKQSVANASQHLQALHAAGLVTRERDGNRVLYQLAGDDVLRLWLALRDTSTQHLAEVERSARDYLGEAVRGLGAAGVRARRLEEGWPEWKLSDAKPTAGAGAG